MPRRADARRATASLGVIVALAATQVDPFDDRTIGLVTTFAAQGAIAIQNVQLFQELEQRGAELARSVDELARARRDQPGGELEPRPRRRC